MPAERFYTPKSPLNIGDFITLEKNEFHHLAHVMRAKTGDDVEIVNGQGFLGIGRILSIKKHEAQLEILSGSQTERPAFEIIILQAIPRANRLDTILEKGTELGMTQIWLTPGILSERKSLQENQLERVNTILVSAMKQCGSLFLPTLTVLPPILSLSSFKFPLFFGDLEQNAPIFETQWKVAPPKEGVIFAIGPESGLAEKEISHLRSLGGIGVKLHENILRTDTAPLVALSLISHWRLGK